MAEIVAHFFPQLVELHNYSVAHGTPAKLYNWHTLNMRVFKRLGFTVAKPDCERIAKCEPGEFALSGRSFGGRLLTSTRHTAGAIEQALLVVKSRLEKAMHRSSSHGAAAPESRETSAPVHCAVRGTRGDAAGVEPPRLTANLNAPLSVARQADAARSIAEKDATIAALRRANHLLEQKVHKLEMLLRLRDAKLAALLTRMGVEPDA